MERLRATPGVTAAGSSTVLGLEGAGWTGDLFVEGRAEVRGRELRHKTIVAGYFAAMGLPLLRGRDFTSADDPSAPAVIVNERLAREFFLNEDPVGRRIAFADPARNRNVTWWSIIGIIADEKQDGLADPVAPEVYDSHRQKPQRGMAVAVRSRIPPTQVLPSLRDQLRSLEPAVAMYDVRTLEEVLARSTSRQRFTTWLVSAFAVVALALAAVGVFGVLAFSVSQRTREIGVRVALGATRGQIVSLVLREAAGLVGIGLLFGVAGAALFARAIRSLLFQTAPGDPLAHLAVVAVLAGSAALATIIPTRRALLIEPTQALRYE